MKRQRSTSKSVIINTGYKKKKKKDCSTLQSFLNNSVSNLMVACTKASQLFFCQFHVPFITAHKHTFDCLILYAL